MTLLRTIYFAGIASIVCVGSAAIPFEWVAGHGNGGAGEISRTIGQGISDPDNVPASRSNGLNWLDLNGNTWIYGGTAFGSHSDMWKLEAATGNWVWIRGLLEIPGDVAVAPVYGTKGVPDPANHPGPRGANFGPDPGSITWTDIAGDLWFLDNLELWRYNIASNQWTWMETFPATPHHGVKGVADAANTPGERNGAVLWSDNNGDVWLFGGSSYTDLWKYSSGSGLWTWVHGSNIPDPLAQYGTKGVPAPENHPGARGYGSGTWVDSSNNLWLFGGIGHSAATTGAAPLNDTWKYSISTNQWTWVAGAAGERNSGSYGQLGQPGTENSPGARYYPLCWKGANGQLYLFSGNGVSQSPVQFNDYHSDLWRLDPGTGQWTWIDGLQFTESLNRYSEPGVAAESNIPASRGSASTWTTPDGVLWLFGGQHVGTPEADHNDLWSYNLGTGMWTFHKGALGHEEKYHHGTQNVAAPENTPGGRVGGITWRDNQGNLWLFGGNSGWYILGSFASNLTRYDMYDLWKFNPRSRLWSWEKGSFVPDAGNGPPAADYGQQGVEAPSNLPSGRVDAVSWTDNLGLLWMFGGEPKGFAANNYLSDLWRFNPYTNNWTWMNGSSVIGDKGHLDPSDPKPYPNARTESVGWKDANGDLWLFGGYSAETRPCTQCGIFQTVWTDRTYHNDLWRYDVDTNQWTAESLGDLDVLIGEIESSRVIGGFGVYQDKGAFSPAAKPGGRRNAYSWTDNDGNFWLYGGYGLGASERGLLHDLWKFNPVTKQWAWMSGTGAVDQASQFGPIEETSASNLPGGNQGGVAWVDQDGNLLLMGGNQWSEAHPNVIWKFDIADGNWSWTEHPSDPTVFNNISTAKGQASVENFPGLRFEPMGWNDPDGTFWLFGGDGYSRWGIGLQGDMWKTKLPPPAAAAGWELYE